MGESTEPKSNGSTVLDRWSARKIRPIIIFYVLTVFAVFIAMAIVVFHSQEAVKALVMAAAAAVVATVPGVIERVEYRMTGSGVEKRPVKKERAAEYKEVFLWTDLDHIVPMRHGFKYYKTLPETRPLGRFWKKHFSDQFSGEIHIEQQDLERVLGIVQRRLQKASTPLARS